MSLLVTATLGCAMAALFGGVSLVRRADSRDPPPPEPSPPPDGAASPFGRLKAVIEAGDWRRALPSLLVLGGILGIMLFGSLALIFEFDHARSGWPMLVLAVATIVWAAREYLRA